jgi:hypothetical protein
MLARLYARRWTLLSLALIVPAGFYCKFYRGPLHVWVNDSLGGTFYVAFWCLVVFLLWPRAASVRIAAGVLVATCVLEFLQLWHPPFLEMLRSHFLGATILGTTFDWGDFPYYFLGAGAGWFWVNRIASREVPLPTPLRYSNSG